MIYCKILVGNKITDLYQFDRWEDFERVKDELPDNEQIIPIDYEEFQIHVRAINKENEALDKQEAATEVNYTFTPEDHIDDSSLTLKILTLNYFKSFSKAADITELNRIYNWLQGDE